MKNFLRRTGMVILFIGALYTTLSSISNVTIMDINAAARQEADDAFGTEDAADRQTVLKEKELNNRIEQKKYISSEQINGPKTLEEAIELEHYPSDTVLATGYTAGEESTGKSADDPEYGITYSGVEVKRDLYSTIAADLDVYPLGTVLYIPDYGYGVVADKGSAITGNRIDLYYPDIDDVYAEWGKQEVEAYVVELGDGSLTEDQLDEWNENEAMQVFREQILDE